MRQQFSMSFRLQRQRGMRPSRIIPWLGAFLIFSMGGWLWIERPAAATPRTRPLPHPEEMALGPLPIAKRPIRSTALPAAVSDQKNLSPSTIPYTFLFEGHSMSGDGPCPNTHIFIRLEDGDRTSVAHGMTDGAGFYSIPLTFEMTPRTSVGWTLEADRQEYQSLEMSGRHIATIGDTSVEIERSFNLALR